MKKDIIKFIISCIIILFIYIIFREMFIERTWSESIHFLKLIHNENRSDLLTFINIIVSTLISYNVYILSKRIAEQNNIEKNREKYESVCIVYDYLNEIVSYTKKIVFKEKENYHILKYNEEFMKHVYNIGQDILDENDIELIRKINYNLKNYINRDKNAVAEKIVIKLLYKNLFDMNMTITQIADFNNMVDIDLLLNPQLVLILSKLRKTLNYEYRKNIEFENIRLKIFYKKGTIIVKKKYNDTDYLENGLGKVKIYEPIFYANEEFYRNGAMIYDGEIYNYIPDGLGTYYYYKSNKEKNIFLDSYNFVDTTAERIKKLLITAKIDVKENLMFHGVFRNGKIVDGVIKFENGKINDIIVEENGYFK